MTQVKAQNGKSLEKKNNRIQEIFQSMIKWSQLLQFFFICVWYFSKIIYSKIVIIYQNACVQCEGITLNIWTQWVYKNDNTDRNQIDNG